MFSHRPRTVAWASVGGMSPEGPHVTRLVCNGGIVTIPSSKPIVASVAALCLVAVCGGAGASHSVAGFEGARVQLLPRSTATVELSRRGEVGHIKVSCSDRRGRLTCARLAKLRRKPLERCLQIWGGPERAVIHLSGMRPIRVTRADSCQMARWAALQKLLP